MEQLSFEALPGFEGPASGRQLFTKIAILGESRVVPKKSLKSIDRILPVSGTC